MKASEELGKAILELDADFYNFDPANRMELNLVDVYNTFKAYQDEYQAYEQTTNERIEKAKQQAITMLKDAEKASLTSDCCKKLLIANRRIRNNKLIYKSKLKYASRFKAPLWFAIGMITTLVVLVAFKLITL